MLAQGCRPGRGPTSRGEPGRSAWPRRRGQENRLADGTAITSPVSPRALRPEPDDPVQVFALRDALGPGSNPGREDCQAAQARNELTAGLGKAVRQQDGPALRIR